MKIPASRGREIFRFGNGNGVKRIVACPEGANKSYNGVAPATLQASEGVTADNADCNPSLKGFASISSYRLEVFMHSSFLYFSGGC
jgi:hypothetical protein